MHLMQFREWPVAISRYFKKVGNLRTRNYAISANDDVPGCAQTHILDHEPNLRCNEES